MGERSRQHRLVWWIGSLVVAATCSLLAGCGGSDTCSSDGDCDGSRICVDGSCTTDWTVGPDGGSDDATDAPSGPGDIELPNEVELTAPSPDTEVNKAIELRNRGSGPLRVTGVDATGSGQFWVTFPSGSPGPPKDDQPGGLTPFEVPDGESRYLRIRFRPWSDDTVGRELVVDSDDPDQPTVRVPLVGKVSSGTRGPCVDWSPKGTLDFGGVDVGSTARKPVTLENCSTGDDLILESTTIEPSRQFGVAFQPRVRVAPGASQKLSVQFAPKSAKSYTGSLEVGTDVPDQKVVEIALEGRGTRTSVCPTAEISGRGGGSTIGTDDQLEMHAQKTLDLDGSGSSAKQGSIDRYEWRVASRPTGSTAHFQPDSSSTSTRVELDLVGTYEFELTVHDSNGVPSCKADSVTVEAVPPSDDLYVEMYWQNSNDKDPTDTNGPDMDLHYLHPNANSWNTAPWDIHWDNMTADWGRKGVSRDDPRMIAEDGDGAGPEAVVHENPQSGQQYVIGVYYYDDNGFGPSSATAKIYFNGKKIADLTQKTMKTFWFWKVGEVDWPTGNFFPRNRVYKSGFPTA